MFHSNDIRCYGFSYDEVEATIKQWNDEAEVVYEGGIVRASTIDDINGGIEYTDFAKVLKRILPELKIAENAITMYVDFGYIYPRRGVDVLVIDGIQEELDCE